MTKADKMGIFVAVGITIIFVGIAAGGSSLEKTISQDFSSIEKTVSEETSDIEKEIIKTEKGIIEFEKAKGDIKKIEESAGEELEDFEEKVISEITGTVSIPEGSSMPGCEEADECYVPFNLRTFVDHDVTWTNNDSAAHTVTSGIVLEGPDGKFDSGLILAGEKYSVIFEEAGEYPYFCMVHPWMTGSITVV